MAGTPAAYFDGRTAARHEVTATIEDGSLTIMDTAGIVLAVWSIGNLRLVESVGYVGYE